MRGSETNNQSAELIVERNSFRFSCLFTSNNKRNEFRSTKTPPFVVDSLASIVSGYSVPLVDNHRPFLHHKDDVPGRGDIGKRITGHGHDVGELAGLERAD